MFRFLTRKKRDPEEVIREVFGDAELPSFPTVVMDVLGQLRNPETHMNEIAVELERDPGLCIRVLRAVNSAASGLSKRVNHVGHAVSLLGRSRLESIVLSVAVKSALPAIDVEGFHYGNFWYTAAKRACMARRLARHLHPATESESFTAGLLQDLGIPLLVLRKKAEYVAVYRQWQSNPDMDLAVLESDAFGFDHTEVGAVVAGHWSLPDYLITAIAGHHDWDGDFEIDHAVRLVSLIRDSDECDGSKRLIEMGANQYALPEDVLLESLASAGQEAEEYRAVLA